MANTYYYMRISTKEASDKQSFQRQYKALKQYAEKNGIEFDERELYKDDCTGSTFDRPDWKKLQKKVKKGDSIIFKEISRFTRQFQAGFDMYMHLMNEIGVNLIFLDNPTVSTDYIQSLINMADNMENRIAEATLKNTIELLLMVELDRVEKEREIIVKRIKDGLAASDKVAGRKIGTLDKMTEELRKDINNYLSDRSIKAIDLIKKHNISRNTLKKYIKVVEEARKDK